MDKARYSAMGKKGGSTLRKRAEKSYYQNPNHCQFCGEIIHLEDGVPPAQTKKKKYCNKSCAAKANNSLYPKRDGKSSGLCERCKTTIHFKPHRNGGYYPRRYCDNCARIARIEARGGTPIEEMTKGQLRQKYPSYMWFGNEISKHARATYFRSGRPYVCKKCGYSLHVDVCHVKDIKDFPDTALVKEINDIENLVALCKNHHWEFDHGHLEL